MEKEGGNLIGDFYKRTTAPTEFGANLEKRFSRFHRYRGDGNYNPGAGTSLPPMEQRGQFLGDQANNRGGSVD